jgi:hypothetical protein
MITLWKVDLGENKALSILTFEKDEGGQLQLGAVVLIPTRKEEGKTFYQPVGVKTPITESQRAEIIIMLGGTPPCTS